MKDLFTNLIKTAVILHIQNTFIDSVQSALNKLMPYPIGSNGQLLEWQQDWRSTDPAHRHLSHMYAVYPGSEISPLTTPATGRSSKESINSSCKNKWQLGLCMEGCMLGKII